MTLLVPRAPFEHAEQRTFSEDRATVITAVEDLAREFDIKASGDGTWELGAYKPDVAGTLEVGADDGRTTLVLRVAPKSRRYTVPQLVTAYYVCLASLWLGLVLFLWLVMHVDLGPSFVIILSSGAVAEDMIKRRLSHRFGPDFYVTPAAAIIDRLERWYSRPGRRWIARWHARFWPALTARLARAQPSR